jgi:NAD-dependent deacetylase
MNEERLREQIEDVAQILNASQRLIVLTGAGISKESGIPTFRDALEGLWANYDPAKLATPRGFKSDPKLVWDWYDYRRGLLGQAQPNPGHVAIAKLQELLPQCIVITQNIDGLHQAGGSRDVIELHGNIKRNKCFANCQGTPTYIDVDSFEWDREKGPPICPYCGDYVRPDVVWFEELLPPEALERSLALTKKADVMLVVGTSGVVHPAASLPYRTAQYGGIVIEVNPELTELSLISKWHLEGPSGAILPGVIAAMEALRG